MPPGRPYQSRKNGHPVYQQANRVTKSLADLHPRGAKPFRIVGASKRTIQPSPLRNAHAQSHIITLKTSPGFIPFTRGSPSRPTKSQPSLRLPSGQAFSSVGTETSRGQPSPNDQISHTEPQPATSTSLGFQTPPSKTSASVLPTLLGFQISPSKASAPDKWHNRGRTFEVGHKVIRYYDTLSMKQQLETEMKDYTNKSENAALLVSAAEASLDAANKRILSLQERAARIETQRQRDEIERDDAKREADRRGAEINDLVLSLNAIAADVGVLPLR